MKVVIDINEHLYKIIKTFGLVVEDEDAVAVSEAIKNSTPLPKGKWIINSEDLYICSNCGEAALHDEWMQFCTDYCPNCGAKMEVEEGSTND